MESDTKELSRRERERLSRRDEILRAAWEVFSSKDYDSATIDDIAAAAELSKGTVYLYFQNKADLFLSTVEMGMEKVGSVIREAVSSIDDPVAGVKEVIRRLLEFAEENLGFLKILSSERAHFEIHAKMASSYNFKERIMDSLTRDTAIMAEHIQRGIDMGVFKRVNPWDAAVVILSALRGLHFRRIVDPESGRLPEKAEVITTILLDGLIRKV